MNVTQDLYFTLTAYSDLGLLKYLYFVLLLCLYVVTVGANVVLLLVICVNRSLHEPMYLFLCSLFVNEVYGSTGLLPFLLLHILSDTHTVPAALCFLQIFCIFSYGSVEFTNLALVAYDRYVAICHPLQYHTLLTPKKVAALIAATWFFPFLAIVVLISLSAPLKLCGSFIHRVYCGNYAIVKLACDDTTANNIYGLIYTVISVIIPFILILYTYLKILRVCFSGCKQSRQKAVSTCSPHLASLINFSFGCCFQILVSRVEASGVSPVMDVLLSVYFLTCQPLLTPLLYGLKTSKIRLMCRRVFSG